MDTGYLFRCTMLRCHNCCKRNVFPGRTYCHYCLISAALKARRKRKLLARKKICVRCGKNKSHDKIQTCLICRDKMRIRNKNKRIKSRLIGKCVGCNNRKAKQGKALCQRCAKTRARRYKQLKDSQTCASCGKARPIKGKLTCSRCSIASASRIRALRWQRSKAGICWQCKENKISIGKRRCDNCISKQGIWARKRYRWRTLVGLCISCGKNQVKGTLKFCVSCRDRNNKRKRQQSKELKLIVFDNYNGRACACCGEDIIDLLTIDHLNNNGAQHRRQIKASGSGFYRWLRKNDYHKGYNVVCFSCNSGRWLNGGVCPHKDIGRGKG